MSSNINDEQQDHPGVTEMPSQRQINISTINKLAVLPLELRQEVYDHYLVKLNQEIAAQARTYESRALPAPEPSFISDWIFSFKLTDVTVDAEYASNRTLYERQLETFKDDQLASYCPVQVWHHKTTWSMSDSRQLELLELITPTAPASSSIPIFDSWAVVFAREAEAYYFRSKLAVIYETLPTFVAWLSTRQDVRENLRNIDIDNYGQLEPASSTARGIKFVDYGLQLRIASGGKLLELRSTWAHVHPLEQSTWQFAMTFFGGIAKRAKKPCFDGTDLLKILQYMARKAQRTNGSAFYSDRPTQANVKCSRPSLEAGDQQLKGAGKPQGNRVVKHVICSYSL